jgi:hypothetical protein
MTFVSLTQKQVYKNQLKLRKETKGESS